jgi:hypothetical protein
MINLRAQIATANTLKELHLEQLIIECVRNASETGQVRVLPRHVPHCSAQVCRGLALEG